MVIRAAKFIARHLLASIGGFLGFLVIPELYFLGASYRERLLNKLSLVPEQFAVSFDALVYGGFKVAITSWISPLLYNVGFVVGVLLVVFSVDALIKAFTPEHKLATTTAKIKTAAEDARKKLGWMAGIVAAAGLIVFVFGSLWLFAKIIGAGEAAANRDFEAIKQRASHCPVGIKDNYWRCATYKAGDVTVTGVPAVASGSTVVIYSQTGSVPLKAENISGILGVDIQPPRAVERKVPPRQVGASESGEQQKLSVTSNLN